MFGFLPESIKEQVLFYLKNDNFPAAKELYDSWLNNKQIISDQCQVQE